MPQVQKGTAMSLMTRTKTKTDAELVGELRGRALEAERQVKEKNAEIHALQDQLAGRKDLMWWVQAKCDRQRKVLDQRQRKAESRAFVLRSREKLGRGLTREESLEARAAEPERRRARIEAPPA